MKTAMKCLGMSLLAALPFWTGCASVHKAAEKGDLTEVGLCLQKGLGVDARDTFGRTPLMLAVGKPELLSDKKKI